MTKKNHYSLGELAKLLDVKLQGDSTCNISGIASLQKAESGQLTFLSNPRYAADLQITKASAVIVSADAALSCPCHCLVSENPYVTYAKASQLFASKSNLKPAIHSSANIHASASLGVGVSIGAHVSIDSGVIVDDGASIAPGTYIGRNSRIGKSCKIAANVSILHDVSIGANVIIHPSVVIGADGFGFAFDGGKSIKIEQLGGVIIGDDVEIGACTTIDRGALEDTIIEQGVKIDNQVQIGHNCLIGAHTIVCGCTGIAGSTTIGKYCQIGGGAGILGHLNIADYVCITATTTVSQSIKKAGYYSSGTGQQDTRTWKRSIVRFRELDEMARRINQLEKSLSTDN